MYAITDTREGERYEKEYFGPWSTSTCEYAQTVNNGMQPVLCQCTCNNMSEHYLASSEVIPRAHTPVWDVQ